MGSSRGKASLVGAAFVLTLATPAWANAGTALMWASMAYLLVGNFVIGLFEGSLLWFLRRPAFVRAVGGMMLANFISAWIGVLFIGIVQHHESALLGPAPLYGLHRFLAAMLVACWAATVVLEVPLLWWILGQRKHRVRQAWVSSLLLQTVSYALLVPYFLSSSATGLLTEVKFDRTLTPGERVEVFFADPVDGRIRRWRGEGEVESLPVRSTAPAELVLTLRKAEDGDGFELWEETKGEPHAARRLVSRATSGRPVFRSKDLDAQEELIAAPGSDWVVSAGYWAAAGLRAENRKTGAACHVALETPFLAWHVSHLYRLSGDQIVFQLGSQVVLLDLSTRRLRWIGNGVAPVVAVLPSR